MSYKYVVRKSAITGGGQPRYLASAFIIRTMSYQEICHDICDMCSLTESDVVAFVSAASQLLAECVKDSSIVQLDSLGSVRATFRSPLCETPEQACREGIRSLNLVLTTPQQLNLELRGAEIVKYVPKVWDD